MTMGGNRYFPLDFDRDRIMIDDRESHLFPDLPKREFTEDDIPPPKREFMEDTTFPGERRRMRPRDSGDALLILAAAMAEGSVKAIDDTLAAGQSEMVTSTDLPAEMQQSSGGQWPQPVLEAAGVKFGKHDGKSVFRSATLPPGWKKVRTAHHLWSNLLDNKGRVRAEIYYKSFFMLEEAFLRVTVRFHVTSETEGEDENCQTRFIVRDTGKNNTAIFSTEPCARDAKYDVYEELRVKANEWLKEHYPEHKDPGAYWDLP